jgi:hypothetical protein
MKQGNIRLELTQLSLLYIVYNKVVVLTLFFKNVLQMTYTNRRNVCTHIN